MPDFTVRTTIYSPSPNSRGRLIKKRGLAIFWVTTIAGSNAEEAFDIFYSNVDNILNVMAPAKLLNRKEIRILMNSWLLKGIVKSIDTRDKLYKSFITEVHPDIKKLPS